MARPYSVAADRALRALLPGSQFMDAFQVASSRQDLNARSAAEAMMADPPAWVDGLMGLRNLLVRPLGLKTGADSPNWPDRIGMFPVVSQSPERVVMGFEDKHLDFRVVVQVASARGEILVTATTIVRLNNLLGRAYLTVIMPFHRIIVPSMLSAIG